MLRFGRVFRRLAFMEERSSRAAWLAVVLGILLPGLGHVYVRQFRKALVVNFIGWVATSLTALIVRDTATAIAPLNLLLAAPWLPSFYVYMSWDAYCLAARQTSAGARHMESRRPLYLAAVCLLLASIMLNQASSSFRTVRPTNVAGKAMAPTILYGEYVLLHASADDGRLPEPGDVVFFQDPEDRDRLFVSRCAATEGQIVAIENGVVRVDGILFDEPEGVRPAPEDFGPEVVPDGHFFVLGDNRGSSFDSRRFGPVPRDHLLGEVVQKLIARDARSGAVRLDRFGELIE